MLDLDFYAALPYGTLYRESRIHRGVWSWMPKYCLIDFPANLEHIIQLNEANWLQVGTAETSLAAMSVLLGQLGQMRVLGEQIWIPRADHDRLIPVLLAFTHVPGPETKQTLPAANLGEIGIILRVEGGRPAWTRCPINRLPTESQQLQQDMGAALSALASARQERSAWLERWKELQTMARKLADDYWRAYQESQVERPKPINIWTLHQGEAALAAMTMIQSGAHAGINNNCGYHQLTRHRSVRCLQRVRAIARPCETDELWPFCASLGHA